MHGQLSTLYEEKKLEEHYATNYELCLKMGSLKLAGENGVNVSHLLQCKYQITDYQNLVN